MPVLRVNSASPASNDSFLQLVQVVQPHVALDLLQLDAGTESCEGVLLQLTILPFPDPNVHHSLELLNDDVLLQGGDCGAFQGPVISLLPELLDELFVMSVLLPGLHHDVGPVKVDDGASFSLPLALIVSLHPLVQVPLLA